MRGMITSLGPAVTTLMLIAIAGASGAQAQPEAVTFTDHIRPIFERSCWNCHGEATQLSDLDLRTRETAIAGGARHWRGVGAPRGRAALLRGGR